MRTESHARRKKSILVSPCYLLLEIIEVGILRLRVNSEQASRIVSAAELCGAIQVAFRVSHQKAGKEIRVGDVRSKSKQHAESASPGIQLENGSVSIGVALVIPAS